MHEVSDDSNHCVFSLLRSKRFIALLTWLVLIQVCPLASQSPRVRHVEGLIHGFAALRSEEGATVATGDISQVNNAGKVTSHLIFRFKDGSVHEETVIYSQSRSFRLLKYHLSQTGSIFRTPTDLSIDGTTGEIIVRYLTDEGKEKVETTHLKLPSDLANGLVPILIKNLTQNAPGITMSMIVTTPKPRLVKIDISPDGQESFYVGETSHKATKYVAKIKIGGVAGVVAPLVGKQPPDTHIWVLQGEAPTFLKSEGILFEGGPVWRLELVSPTWSKEAPK